LKVGQGLTKLPSSAGGQVFETRSAM